MNIFVYHNEEDGKILGYSAREDPEFCNSPFVMVPLDEMRKFYDNAASITSYEILNGKLQKRDEYVYDESYVNDDFFGIEYLEDADFRIVQFDDCVVIFPCDIDHEDPEFRDKLEFASVVFYFTKKDDPSIIYQEVTFDGLQTSLTVTIEGDFSIFAVDATFTYSLESASSAIWTK